MSLRIGGQVRKTHARLADGREIIYFDDSAGATRVLVDPRPPSKPDLHSTIRYDVTSDEWVTLAGHRQDRTHLPPESDCPLCPSRGGRQSEIPSPDYDVVVFENRFPAFTAAPPDGHVEEWQRDRLFSERPGWGRCEVVCFTSAHDSSFSALTPTRAATVIEAWVDRSRALAAMPFVEQVFCFENRGEEIGVTLNHPHGQIYGYPFVTPRSARILSVAARYRSERGSNLFADLLAAETLSSERVVIASDCWTAFVPFAAHWPLEVHLYPNRKIGLLEELTAAERSELAEIYLELLRRMEAVYEDPLPYISAWHQAPLRAPLRDEAYLHLEVFSPRRAPGRLKYLAGSESAMDAFVNDVLPEQAAEALRGALR